MTQTTIVNKTTTVRLRISWQSTKLRFSSLLEMMLQFKMRTFIMDINAITTKFPSIPEENCLKPKTCWRTQQQLPTGRSYQFSISPTTRLSSTSKFNWQHFSYSLDAICFWNFQETGQQNSKLLITAIKETIFLGNTIFHNSIPLYFSAQVASKQLQHKEYFTSSNATYFKSNQKLQTTAELTIFSSHIQQLNVEQITYWSYPIFEL